jgi:5-methylthioribose kinase
MEIDIEQRGSLEQYLLARGIRITDFQVLSGGVSNKTVWVRVDGQPGHGWVVKQCLEKLRVQADWHTSPERLHVEALALQRMPQVLLRRQVPRFIFEDEDHHILAMQAVEMPHRTLKQHLLAGEIERGHIAEFALMLGMLHATTSEHLADFEADFGDRSFYETLRLEAYYGFSAENVPEAAPFLHRLIADTRAHRLAVVHGDYSPKNVIVTSDGLVLLDYEVMHIGDPTFDIGFAMTHLLSKAHHLPSHRPALLDAARLFAGRVLMSSGDLTHSADYEARAVRQTLGCMMARVAGRSPLEYLSDAEKARQRDMVLALMTAPPAAFALLIDQLEGMLT